MNERSECANERTNSLHSPSVCLSLSVSVSVPVGLSVGTVTLGSGAGVASGCTTS